MEYRLYWLGETGHIVSRKDLSARDDLAALQQAESACEKHVVEIWQGERRVARVKLGNAQLLTSDRMSL